MDSSICGDAYRCGSFDFPACTNATRRKECSGPVLLNPGSNATDRLSMLLPIPCIGDCKIGGEKGVPVYKVNDSVAACLFHYVTYVLQNRPMPEKRTKLEKDVAHTSMNAAPQSAQATA